MQHAKRRNSPYCHEYLHVQTRSEKLAVGHSTCVKRRHYWLISHNGVPLHRQTHAWPPLLADTALLMVTLAYNHTEAGQKSA